MTPVEYNADTVEDGKPMYVDVVDQIYKKCLPKSTERLHFVTIAQKERGDIVKDEWTGEAAAIMHINDISALALAEKLGWNPKYLSSVLNCKRCPKNAEAMVMNALHEIVQERTQT